MINLNKKSMLFFKIVIIFTLASVLLIYPTISSAQKDFSALVKKVVPSVVVINVYDIDGKLKSLGTGFFVTPDGGLVTNYHVIEGGMRAEAKLSSGEVLLIEGIVSEDRDGDLVLLTLGARGRSFQPLKLADAKIEAGQMVLVIGSPYGFEGTVSDGIVSAVRDLPKSGKILQITAAISKGSSGSPVLNMKGEVVGVATSYIQEGQSLNFAISVERIARLLSHQQTKFRKLAELIKEEKWSESPTGLFILGWSFFENGHYEKAISYLKKSIVKNPNDSVVYQALGLAYGELGRYYEAIEVLKISIRLNPNSSDAHVNLGMTYGRLNRYDEAINAFKHAIRINPNDASAHYGIGLSNLMIGNKKMALEEYKILKELDAEMANKLFNLIYK